MDELIVAKKKIAVARLVLRERRPPPPKLSVRLRPQHLRYEVGSYRERLRSGPGGLGRSWIWKPDLVGEQHNLVVNSVGDTMAVTDWSQLAVQALVGTGSNAPSVTDTALQNQVAWSITRPPGSQDKTTYGGSPGIWIREVRREFTPSQVGGVNLTEWGFADASNRLLARELFRDSTGNPIVLTLASDQGLRLYYSYQITLAPITQAVSINITNIGTVTGTLGISRYSTTGRYDFDTFTLFATASPNLNIFVFLTARTFAYDNGVWGADNYVAIGGPPLPASGAGYYSYTSGSRQRQIRVEIPTSAGNGTIYALGFGNKNAVATGIYLKFDPGSEITKDSLHKLVLDPWTITW